MGRREMCLAVSVEAVRLPQVWAFDPLIDVPTSVLAALDRFLSESDGIVDNGRPGDLAALNAVLANLGSGRLNRAQRRAR